MQSCTNRSVEQNRELRNKPTNIQSTDICLEKIKDNTIKKESLFNKQ